MITLLGVLNVKVSVLDYIKKYAEIKSYTFADIFPDIHALYLKYGFGLSEKKWLLQTFCPLEGGRPVASRAGLPQLCFFSPFHI